MRPYYPGEDRTGLPGRAGRDVPRGKSRQVQERCRLCGKEAWAVLPAIFRLDTRKTWDREQTARVLASYDGILIRNIEEFFYLREAGVSSERMMGDGSIYLYNRETRAFWQEHGSAPLYRIPGAEYWEIADVGCEDSELVVYGRTALMYQRPVCQKNGGTVRQASGGFVSERPKRRAFSGKDQLRLLL